MWIETGSVQLASALVAPTGAALGQPGVADDKGFDVVFGQPLPLAATEGSLAAKGDSPIGPWPFWAAIPSSLIADPLLTGASAAPVFWGQTGQDAASLRPIDAGLRSGVEADLVAAGPTPQPLADTGEGRSQAAAPLTAPDAGTVNDAVRLGVPGTDQGEPASGIPATSTPSEGAMAGRAVAAENQKGAPWGKAMGQLATTAHDLPAEASAASSSRRLGLLMAEGAGSAADAATVLAKDRAADVAGDRPPPPDLMRLSRAESSRAPADLTAAPSGTAEGDEVGDVLLSRRSDPASPIPAPPTAGGEEARAPSEPAKPNASPGQPDPAAAGAAPAPLVRQTSTDLQRPVPESGVADEKVWVQHPIVSWQMGTLPSGADSGPDQKALPARPDLGSGSARSPFGTEAERFWLGLPHGHEAASTEAGGRRGEVPTAIPAPLGAGAAGPSRPAASTQVGPGLPALEQAERLLRLDSEGVPFAWSPTGQLVAVGSSLAGPLPATAVPQLVAGIAATLQHRADGTTEIALSPDELGTVRLRLEADARDPERMIVHLAFDRPDTMDLFRRHADQLTEAIRAAGYAEAKLDFGQHGTGAEARGGQEPSGWGNEAATTETDPGSSWAAPDTRLPLRLANAAGLDLRL